VRPLRSPGVTPLLRYYGPLRLPAAATLQVMDSPQMLPSPYSAEGTTPGLPGSLTDLSTRALPNHPGRPDRCIRSFLPCRLLASTSLAVWPPPFERNGAESGSLSLGLTPSLSRKGPSLSPPGSVPGNRPTAHVRLPCMGDRSYMLNEQLTRLTHFSQIDQPGLSWRTRARRGKKKDNDFLSNEKTIQR